MVDLIDLWIYVYEKGEARFTDLEREFVTSKKRSKSTILKYKKQLEEEGKLAKKISQTTKGPVYYVPKEFRLEIKRLLKGKLLWREWLKKFPEAFSKSLEQTHEVYKAALTLGPDDIKWLYSLLGTYLRLRESEQYARVSDSQKEWRIDEEGDYFVVRRRKTGEIWGRIPSQFKRTI